MKKHSGMRPQDIVILLKIIAYPGNEWRNYEIADSLQMSASEVSESLNRSKLVRLVDFFKRDVYGEALLELIIHGLKYVFPADPGRLVRGIPTAHSASPLVDKIGNTREKYVWKLPGGTHMGQVVEPLYHTVPSVAVQDPFFHELLALTDAIRIARERERNIAIKELRERIA